MIIARLWELVMFCFPIEVIPPNVENGETSFPDDPSDVNPAALHCCWMVGDDFDCFDMCHRKRFMLLLSWKHE